MQVTYEQLQLVSYPEQTAGALAFHAKTSQSPVSKKDSLPESVVLCFLQLQGLLETSEKKIDPATCSLRTLKTYLVLTEGLTFSNFKLNWTKSGTMSNGTFSTQPKSSLNTGNASSLSDILEDDVPEKYFLWKYGGSAEGWTSSIIGNYAAGNKNTAMKTAKILGGHVVELIEKPELMEVAKHDD